MTARIEQLFAGAAHAVGFHSSASEGTWAECAKAAGYPTARRAVVVLIDGMGVENLAHYRGHIPFLRRHLQTFATTTFPSTTACAITSFATGYLPGTTGMAGFTLRHPQHCRRLQLLSFIPGEAMGPEASSSAIQVDPASWQPHPPIAARIDHGGTICSVGPKKFAGSGLTVAAWRGIRPVYARELSERVDATLRELRSETKLVYLYWEGLDHVGHQAGWNSEAWVSEVENVDRELSRLAGKLPADTLLVITADHGMVDIDKRVDLADFAPAASWQSAGEERALHVYFPPGEDHQRAREALQSWLDTRGEVFTRSEYAALLGPVAPAVAPRLGDVIVAAAGSWGISDSRWMSAGQRSLIGAHGSTTAMERHIPLIVTKS